MCVQTVCACLIVKNVVPVSACPCLCDQCCLAIAGVPDAFVDCMVHMICGSPYCYLSQSLIRCLLHTAIFHNSLSTCITSSVMLRLHLLKLTILPLSALLLLHTLVLAQYPLCWGAACTVHVQLALVGCGHLHLCLLACLSLPRAMYQSCIYMNICAAASSWIQRGDCSSICIYGYNTGSVIAFAAGFAEFANCHHSCKYVDNRLSFVANNWHYK